MTQLLVSVHQLARALTALQLGAALRRSGNRDPELWHQGVYPARGARLDQAKLGPFEHQATPYHLERTAGPRRPTPAPLLGDHTEHVCVHLLGLPAERLDAGLFT